MARMAVNSFPFKSSPSPKYLYMTSSLEEVCEKARYVIDERLGLTVIYGENGHGKSSILRHLYGEYAARPDVEAALIPSPTQETDLALLKAICDEFGIPRKRAKLDQENEMRGFLLDLYAQEKNCVVFIDEAQGLRGRVLELVRALLNFETDEDKLIQIVLCGQLELRDRLRDKSKRAIRDRIFTASTLDALSRADTGQMIAYRCERARSPIRFPEEAVERIYQHTGGVPRAVVRVAGLAWKFARDFGETEVSVEAVDAAFRSTDHGSDI
jgi:general secretion pathway protein A